MENVAVVHIGQPRERIRSEMLMSLSGLCDRPAFVIFKEVVDLMFATITMLFFMMIFPLIALVIKLDSQGPVFYTQKRVGRKGREFKIYKFRTMFADAEKTTGPIWSVKGDPRITEVGHWLRKTYLDELPQCINIIRGDMSLVGPRPERPEFMDEFERLIPGFFKRCSVKPGITGLAQVSRTYKMVASDIRRKLTYDLFYIRKQCCVLDLRIILRTINFWVKSCVR